MPPGSTQRTALYIGVPAPDLAPAMAAVGLELVHAGPEDARAALQQRAPAIVIVDATGIAVTALQPLLAVVQARRFAQPCIVLAPPASLPAIFEPDLALPAPPAPADLAARAAELLAAQPRQILHEHRRVIATLPRPAWLIDASGLIAAINAPAADLFGKSGASMLGQPWQALLGNAVAGAFRWLFVTRRTGDRAELGVIQVPGAGGAQRKIECLASGIWAGVPDAGGVFVGTLVLSTDVTAAHLVDAQVMQATKLEAMGRLAGGIAHDFNNLLSVIIGTAQLVRHDFADHPGVEDLREIENAGMRAAEMTKQLLVFSRKQEPETTTFDVSPMIRNASKMLRRLLGERVQLELALADRSLGIRADVVQLEQILVNLAVNARDAMPQGGHLWISADAVDVRDHKATWPPGMTPGAWVQITVRDEGEGMSAETLEHAFEPFFTTKGKDQGTGLGLSVVYGIVKRHGGHIDAHSELGRGTTFRVWFPQVVELASKPAVQRSVMRAGGERILLVEDDDMVRRFLTRTLEAHGYSVLPVADPTIAVAVAASFPALDLLVADVQLPSMLGNELAAKLRERFPALRVIYISGQLDLSHAAQLLGDQSTFLAKPINASRFLGAVRDTLDR